jgi:hypothetical protein
MAFFTFLTSIGAGLSANPLDISGSTWKYNRLPWPATVEVMSQTTAAGVVVRMTSGSDEIMQESPIHGTGTANALPARLSVEPVTWQGDAGDVVQLQFRNTTAGTLVVAGTIEITKRA